MKKSLSLYLTILAVLTTVFTYMFLSKQVAFEQTRYEKTTKKLRDSLSVVVNQLADANYFSLAKNENAQNYFDSGSSEKTIQYEQLIPYVTEKLLDNNSNPKGNPYTGQDQIGANKFIIRRIEKWRDKRRCLYSEARYFAKIECACWWSSFSWQTLFCEV